MNHVQLALARRAVACEGWKWLPGMADQFGRRVMQVYPEKLGFKWSHLLENNLVRDADALPDLTDASTLGCLLALVREAWGYPSAHVQRMFTAGAGWLAYTNDDGDRDHRFYGATEAEALVAALEAASKTNAEHSRKEEE